MGDLRKAERFDIAGAAAAGTGSAGMYFPSLVSEVRIHGAFGSYYISWDGEIHDPDVAPLQVSDGPYLTFQGALRVARRKIRKDRRMFHEGVINAQWQAEN
jgi:hypothetical protein